MIIDHAFSRADIAADLPARHAAFLAAAQFGTLGLSIADELARFSGNILASKPAAFV